MEITHPISNRAIGEDFPIFINMLVDRLRAGADQYGDASFSKDPKQLLDEIQQELLDISGWSFVLFCRIREMRRAIEGSQKTLDKKCD